MPVWSRRRARLLPLPSEIILPFAGVLVAAGTYSWTGAIVAALAGGLAGAFAAYAVGRWGRGAEVSPASGRSARGPRCMTRWWPS